MSCHPVDMQVRHNVRSLCSRMHTLLHRRKQKRTMEISQPFDFKLEPVALPGVSQDELALLREKATASRVGIAEYVPRSSSYYSAPPLPASVSWDSASRAHNFVYNRARTPRAPPSRRPVW